MGRNINRRMSGLILRGGVWHIDKVIHGTRVCESTGTSDLEEAEALLMRRLQAARATRLFGAREEHTFAGRRRSTWKRINTSAAWNGMRGRWRLWIRTSGNSRYNDGAVATLWAAIQPASVGRRQGVSSKVSSVSPRKVKQRRRPPSRGKWNTRQCHWVAAGDPVGLKPGARR